MQRKDMILKICTFWGMMPEFDQKAWSMNQWGENNRWSFLETLMIPRTKAFFRLSSE
jgi:hypothetical protein